MNTMNYAKTVYDKYMAGKSLSDTEVLEGAKALKELSKDLSECFGFTEASKEAASVASRLNALATQRGIKRGKNNELKSI